MDVGSAIGGGGAITQQGASLADFGESEGVERVERDVRAPMLVTGARYLDSLIARKQELAVMAGSKPARATRKRRLPNPKLEGKESYYEGAANHNEPEAVHGGRRAAAH